MEELWNLSDICPSEKMENGTQVSVLFFMFQFNFGVQVSQLWSHLLTLIEKSV